jgi:hypothetical protein
MKIALVTAAISVACSSTGPYTPYPPSGPAAAIEAFGAARFVPAHPTYLLVARTIGDSQRSLRDLTNSFGLLVGATADDVSRALAGLLGVDPLSTSSVEGIGIDPSGGAALFSEDLDPTIVVHLAAPDRTAAFFARRIQGIEVKSATADGVAISTATLVLGVRVSWAIAGDWLWVHFAIGRARDDDAWFVASHHPADTAWSDDLAWARDVGRDTRGIIGYFHARDVLDAIVARSPWPACKQLAEPLGRVALATEGDAQTAGVRLAFELSPEAATALASHVLPPPAGWATTTAGAPLAVQWNLDVDAVIAWAAPCMPIQLGELKPFGIRAARAIVRSIDADDGSGTGVVSLDLASASFFAQQLDRIPLRSHLESTKRFGPWEGRHLSIPLGPTVDYILTDRVAMIAMGDGLLEHAVGNGAGAGGPLIALDVVPSAMPAAAWAWLFGKAGLGNPRWLAEQLSRWQSGHITLAVDGRRLILEVHGKRR